MSYSGLQRHSKGEHYPWAVVGVGDQWIAKHLLTGEESPRFPTVQALYESPFWKLKVHRFNCTPSPRREFPVATQSMQMAAERFRFYDAA